MTKYGEEIALELLISGIESMEFVPVPILQGLSKRFFRYGGLLNVFL